MTRMVGPDAPLAEAPDEVLVAAARQGDLLAWERLVRRYQEEAFRIAYLIGRTMHLAEASVEAAFIRAYRALPSLAEGSPARPWLLRITAAEARQRRRAAGRPRLSSRPDEPRHMPRIPASRLAGGEAFDALTPAQREEVVVAFDRLSEDDRLLIATRYLLLMSRTEAAAALAIPERSVDDRLRTAVSRMRSRLGDQR